MIYLDNAGTTPVLEECIDIVEKNLRDDFFNPSALYMPSVKLSQKIAEARTSALRALRGDGDFIFTASGSEGDNTALFGTKKPNNCRIVVSASEHPAVYNCAMELKQRGYDVVFCDVDRFGRVKEDAFREAVDKNTALVSIMHVNNETGCVNDVKKLCAIAKEINPDVLFHSDGVQAVGKIKVNLQDMNVDLYTVSGHKLHAPKGVAGLYIKKGVYLKPYIFGGGQEGGLRSGTENGAGILAFAYALTEAVKKQKESQERVEFFRKKILDSLDENFYAVDCEAHSPFVLCLAMKYVRGEVMLHSLEKYGIYIGTGSACSSKKGHKRLPSMLGLDENFEKGVLRISMSRLTTEEEVDCFIEKLHTEYRSLLKYVRG